MEGRGFLLLTTGSVISGGGEDEKGSISHGETLSGLGIDVGSSH